MVDFVNDEQNEEFKSFEIPYVEDQKPKFKSESNAFNKTSDWKWEPPEEEEEILPPTAEEIEAIRKAAYEEGFLQGLDEGQLKGYEEGLEKGTEEGQKKGYEQGLSEGLQEGRDIIQQQMQAWQSLNGSLQEPLTLVEAELEKELTQLAVALARSVIRTEVQLNENIIFEALKSGLKVLPIRENGYQINLHPEDLTLVKQHFSEEEIQQHNWILVESVGQSRGGCEIVTDSNAVDVSIERRVRESLDKFLLEQGLREREAR
ncbi:flagellar assembly protein FliH [Planctobacterium marinum]|uniref:Flagellar assembly protein FliH n=1 Tax=Planctobacterium marinum TaxID=1631968 RepID=A0AA48HXK4_9ALTE|nr:flagellar assembly protein FliH [Planctobacterium marinum]